MLKILTLVMMLGTVPWQCHGKHKQLRQVDATIVTSNQKTVAKDTNQLPACVKTDCNCSDFKHQKDAQAVLEAFSNDPYRLDRNKDGVACESLPK